MFMRLLPDQFILIETVRNGAADNVECSVLSLQNDKIVESVDSWLVSDLATGVDQRFFFIYDQELISVLVRPITTGVVPRGTFSTIWLCKGNRANYIKISCLNSGYINTEYPLDWPANIKNRYQVCPAPILGRAIAGLAGASILFTVTQDVEIEILGIMGTHTASVAAGNRNPFVEQQSPGAVASSLSESVNFQVVNSTANIFIQQSQIDDNLIANDVHFRLNKYLLFNTGNAILDVLNRDVADIWVTTEWTYRERILL